MWYSANVEWQVLDTSDQGLTSGVSTVVLLIEHETEKKKSVFQTAIEFSFILKSHQTFRM